MAQDLVKVKMDAVGKAAEAFLELKHLKEGVIEKLGRAEKELIQALHEAKRDEIHLEGETLKVKFIASCEKIVVKK